jgi:hypothetical protein
MQANQPKGGNAEAITTPFAVGDKVSYLTIAGGGRSYRFCARTGVITEVDGDLATLRAGNGRSVTLPLDKLTPEGQPNALTRMLLGGK